ncbi:hypothetical protein R3X27_07805 [Tropicimonas sp. TH_r6]|uniref:hypothetical protein n=1 Tax=Tropicimonas sp. TH_r6 TaxID=3082085 RepID=UPI002954C217|nr:hypothetical protein [Tropicimonas sp. TH_r6]MDV7142585.1 hypothetical protein [Tropicimonas sp. TH_r6]
MRVGELFKIEPDEWGLRGDQILWRELAETLADTPMPADLPHLERLLEDAFWEATGQSLAFSTEFTVPRFAEEGKTRGGISGAIWRYRLFPMIIRKYVEIAADAAA